MRRTLSTVSAAPLWIAVRTEPRSTVAWAMITRSPAVRSSIQTVAAPAVAFVRKSAQLLQARVGGQAFEGLKLFGREVELLFQAPHQSCAVTANESAP